MAQLNLNMYLRKSDISTGSKPISHSRHVDSMRDKLVWWEQGPGGAAIFSSSQIFKHGWIFWSFPPILVTISPISQTAENNIQPRHPE